MATTGHELEAVNVQGLKASLQKLKTDHIDGKADEATTLAGYGITDAYTKTEVNGLVDTPHQNYVTVAATSQTTAATDVLPASGQAADTIYRVSNWDGSANSGAGAFDVSCYSEYAWDDVSNPNKYVFLCVRPQVGEVFDISVYNNNATYADLAAALGNDGANVPESLRKGGMSVKYVQTSDNKYKQFTCRTQSFSDKPSDWYITDVVGEVNGLVAATDTFVYKFSVVQGAHSSTKDRFDIFIPKDTPIDILVKNITTSNTGNCNPGVLYKGESSITSLPNLPIGTKKRLTFEKDVVSIGFYWSATVGSSSGDMQVEITTYPSSRRYEYNSKNLVTFVSNKSVFDWENGDNNSRIVTIGNNISIRHLFGNDNTNITLETILQAASAATGFSVNDGKITFPAAGTMYYDMETNTVGFVNNITICDNERYTSLFENSYGSVSGLLVEYALRKAHNETKAEFLSIEEELQQLEQKYYELATIAFNENGSFTLPLNVKTGQKIVLDITSIDSNTSYSIFTVNHSSTVYGYANAVKEMIIEAAFDGKIGLYKQSGGNIQGTFRLYSANDILDKKIETTNNELGLLTYGAEAQEQELTEVPNYFISQNGNVLSNASFAYTQALHLNKGDLIAIKARGYQTNVSILSKVITSGSSYQPVIVSTDSEIHNWFATINEDGDYAFSYFKKDGLSVKKLINTPKQLNDRIEAANGVLFKNTYYGIPTIGIIGDSLSSGAGYNPNTEATNDHIEYAWWKPLERKSGREWKRFCKGGMSTRSFITDNTYGLPAALTQGNECELYIMALEVNDRSSGSLGPSYLGSVSDIDLNNPDNNQDTFYGNYARIIQKITAVNSKAHFILFTEPRTDGDFNNAIRTIADMFDNCYLVDLWALYSSYFISGGYYKNLQDRTAHYPAIAYASMADLFEKAINDCINSNLTDFKEIQY